MNSQTTAARITQKLTETFAPQSLSVTDESARHIGHAGSRPGGETHFHIAISSRAFAGLTKVASHRAIYAALADEMKDGGIHALALDVSAGTDA